MSSSFLGCRPGRHATFRRHVPLDASVCRPRRMSLFLTAGQCIGALVRECVGGSPVGIGLMSLLCWDWGDGLDELFKLYCSVGAGDGGRAPSPVLEGICSYSRLCISAGHPWKDTRTLRMADASGAEKWWAPEDEGRQRCAFYHALRKNA